jgi:hypothetical protein
MPESAPRPIRRIRDRQWLLAREHELADRATAVDAEQRRLAQEFLELRRELVAVHSMLWPRTPGHDRRKWRAPRLGGPAPVPPTFPDATPVSGRALRRAVLAALARAAQPLTLTEIHRELHLRGHRLAGAHPVKQLGDALRYEEQRGRVRRVARGTYAVSHLSPANRRAAAR